MVRRHSSRLSLTYAVPLQLACAALATPPLPASAAGGFEAQTVDAGVEIGYGVVTGDVDGDGRADILLADKTEVRWYRNPDWTPSVMAKRLTLRDNVCIAARDIDGDGKVEVAVGAQWNPGETRDTLESGAVFYLLPPEDRTAPWTPVQLPHEPTTHRMHWVSTAEGGHALAVLPLHGTGGGAVNLALYHPPADPPDRADPAAWKTEWVATELSKTHNFDTDGATVVVGGAEGTFEWPSLVKRLDPLGFGEVRRGGGLTAAISPMHGNLVRVTAGPGAYQTLDDSLGEGHALIVADLLGTGSDQVVAGWRKPDAEGKVGIRLYQRSDGGDSDAWESTLIDDNTMACEDLKAADLDGDGDLDLVAAGRATHNLVIYWNKN